MKKLGVALVGLLLGCTVSDETLKRVVESNGLHDVQRAGWAPLSCGRGDGLRSHFTAKTAQGKVVRGTVCCGRIFKDCTVRYE